jgi:uncharacterized protein (TIGR01370 family)
MQGVTRVVPAFVILILLAAAGAGAAGAHPRSTVQHTPRAAGRAAADPSTPVRDRFRAARTFSFALGAPRTSKNLARLAQRDLIVVDGEEVTPAQVAALRSRGTVVLGYLSVGSVETWRSWFAELRDYRLEPLGDWDGERYADTAQPALRDALADRIAPQLLAKGLDGLFLDNVDMIEEHAAQADGMVELVTRLSARAHAAGGVLMAQNGDAIIDRFVPALDGWNREDPTGTYDFDRKRYVLTDAEGRRSARATLRRLHAAGLVTTTADYFASPRAYGARQAVRLACQVGAIPSIGDIGLRRVARRPARCPTNPGA